MRKSLTVAVLTAATLFAAGTSATAEEAPSSSPSPTTESGESTELERVSAYTQPSVVYIGITWTGYVWDKYNKLYLNNEQPIELNFQCTGYVVNPDGYIATAGHCVDPNEVIPQFNAAAAQWALENDYYAADNLTMEDVLGFDDFVVQNQEGKRGPERAVTTAWSVSAGGVETGKALPARVVKWQKFDNGDGAMLKVEAENLNALPLAEEDIEIGTEVVAVGYPGSVDLVADQTFTPSYKEGAVSSKKTVSNGLLTVYEISAAVSGGMSGGPTVNLQGEVVGFNSFGINSDIETQQFNFVRPVGTVQELLGDAGTTSELSEDAQSYRDGLDAYFAGDKAEAIENLEAVVDSQPTHDLAAQYLDKAEALPDPPKEEEGSSMGLILGIIGGLVLLGLIVVGVLFAILRKKKGGPSVAPAPQQYAGPPPPAAPPAGFQPTPAPPIAVASDRTETTVLAPPVPQDSGATVGATATQAPMEVVDTTLFCANCGTKGEPAQKFCKHCGTAL